MKKLDINALSIGVLGAVFLKDISGLFLYGISGHPWNDDVTADEVHTLECKKCKNKVSKTFRVTKNIRGSGRL